MKTLYMTAFGVVWCEDRSINGVKIPEDTFQRACRLEVKFNRNRWEYCAEWMYRKGMI
jgi:hypothetical protein